MEIVLRTSKIALKCRQIHAYTSRFEMGASPHHFICVWSCRLTAQTAQDSGAEKHTGLLQPNPPTGHGVTARGAPALALAQTPGICCCSSLPARDPVQGLVWIILLQSFRPEGTMTWFDGTSHVSKLHFLCKIQNGPAFG